MQVGHADDEVFFFLSLVKGRTPGPEHRSADNRLPVQGDGLRALEDIRTGDYSARHVD